MGREKTKNESIANTQHHSRATSRTIYDRRHQAHDYTAYQPRSLMTVKRVNQRETDVIELYCTVISWLDVPITAPTLSHAAYAWTDQLRQNAHI